MFFRRSSRCQITLTHDSAERAERRRDERFPRITSQCHDMRTNRSIANDTFYARFRGVHGQPRSELDGESDHVMQITWLTSREIRRFEFERALIPATWSATDKSSPVVSLPPMFLRTQDSSGTDRKTWKHAAILRLG